MFFRKAFLIYFVALLCFLSACSESSTAQSPYITWGDGVHFDPEKHIVDKPAGFHRRYLKGMHIKLIIEELKNVPRRPTMNLPPGENEFSFFLSSGTLYVEYGSDDKLTKDAKFIANTSSVRSRLEAWDRGWSKYVESRTTQR